MIHAFSRELTSGMKDPLKGCHRSESPPAALGLLCLCVFCQHKYISISDVQIKNEEELEKCPMSLVRSRAPRH